MQEAQLVHEELRAIAQQRQTLHAREAVLLIRAEELEIWRHFGCATFFEYLERFCDLHPRTAREYLRVARVLDVLPLMRAQLDARHIPYSTARELTRIAQPATEAEWLRAVEGLTAREIEERVSGHKPGDRPNDAKEPDRMIKVMFSMRESTYAQYLATCTRFADDRGEPLTEDEVMQAFCRPVEIDINHRAAPHRVAITTCRTCAKSNQVAAGREIEVSQATAERARCDARDFGDLESDARQRTASSVTPRMREQVLMRDGFMCSVPGCRSQRYLDAHHLEWQCAGGPHKPSNILTLCFGHHHQLHAGKLVITGIAPHELTFTWL